MNLDMTRMIGPVKHKLAAFTIGVLILAVNAAWAVVGRENFRELLVSAQSAAWPNTLVQDEDCRMPATIGEDYAGPACTGKLIAAASSSEMPSNISEDYAGALQPVVQARQTAIRIVAVTQPASSLALTAKK